MAGSASNPALPQFAAELRMRFGALALLLLSASCTRLDGGGIAR